MGVDLCACFTHQAIPIQAFIKSSTVQQAQVRVLYVVAGEPRPDSGHLAYFALWTDDEDFDLGHLCCELSTTTSPLCAAWKAEHGGVGGYSIYVDGKMMEAIDTDDATYLLLPVQGVEQVFLRSLPLADDDRVCFPELLFDEHVTCYALRPDGSYSIMPEHTVTQLFEDDLDVEPSFPFTAGA